MQKRFFLLRRLLLNAGIFSGLLIFWLPAHEVFEGPKSIGFLISSCLLLAASAPLLFTRHWNPRLRPWLAMGGALLGCSLLSFIGAYRLLPSNVLLCLEKLAPMLAACLAALLYILESEDTRKRVLFCVMASHLLLIFYGLVQILDQNLGSSSHPIDLIRWTSFGESRVYSTLGNPDYMAAHLTLFVPLWLALPWRDAGLRLKAAFTAAAVALALIPLPVLLVSYGVDPHFWAAVMRAYPLWALTSLAFFVLGRKLSARTLWITAGYMACLLVLVAQGRAAYLGALLSAAVTVAVALSLGGRALIRRHAAWLKLNAAALGLGALLLAGAYALRAQDPSNGLLNLGPVKGSLRVSDALLTRLGDFFARSSDATNVRRFYYKAALRMGFEHPLFGVGFGNHALFTAEAQSEVWKDWEKSGNPSIRYVEPHVELYTHNDFLQNFAETGFLGLLAFLAFWGFFLFKSWTLAQRGWGDARGRLGLGMLGLATAFLTSAMLNFPWRVLATQQLCWLSFAMLAVADTGHVPEKAPETGKIPALSVSLLLPAFLLALIPARWFYATSLFKQGNLARDQNRYADGAKYYGKAVEAGLSGTQSVEIFLYLGSMQNMLGRPDLAEAWFKKGVTIYPAFIESYYNLGYTAMLRYGTSHLDTDRLQAANYFERVLEINPRYANALNNLGNLYYAVKDFPRAAASYEKLIRFAPDTLEARYNLGVTYLMMNRRAECIVQLEEALRLKPDYMQARQLVEQIKKLPATTRLKFQ